MHPQLFYNLLNSINLKIKDKYYTAWYDNNRLLFLYDSNNTFYIAHSIYRQMLDCFYSYGYDLNYSNSNGYDLTLISSSDFELNILIRKNIIVHLIPHPISKIAMELI